MRLEKFFIFYIGVLTLGRIWFLINYAYSESKLLMISIILNIILVIYGMILLILYKKNSLNLKQFIFFFSSEILITIENTLLCYSYKISHTALYEQGLIGGLWDILINLVLITFILDKIRGKC